MTWLFYVDVNNNASLEPNFIFCLDPNYFLNILVTEPNYYIEIEPS